MAQKCLVCSSELDELGDKVLLCFYCPQCYLLMFPNGKKLIEKDEANNKEISKNNLTNFSHISDDKIFALQLFNLTIEEAWNLISESHELTNGRKPNVIVLETSLGQIENPYEFFEAIAILLSDSGTLIIEDKSTKDLAAINSITADKNFYYFSTTSLNKLVEKHNLQIVDVENANNLTRWYIKHNSMYPVSPSVTQALGEDADSISSQLFVDILNS